MTDAFYPELLARYRQLLADKPSLTGASMSSGHIAWMLYELEHNQEMSLTKKHRWLGYVQGVLTVAGYIEVDSERDLTRGIFNGA